MKYSYKNSGVDLEAAQNTSSQIGEIISNNAFAGMVEHPMLEDYYLCSTTDGIGTKLIPLLGKLNYKTIANDLIAMNLNDLACVGAFPVSFLDYIAVNKLDDEVVLEIVKELKSQLKNYNCELVGGEVAELSSMIKNTDIAGFVTGLVKKENLLGGHKVQEGDVIIGLKSNGVHANGFSLVNKLLQDGKLSVEDVLAPTHIYINKILEVQKELNACANITGGGILENVSRVIPDGLCAQLEKDAIPKLDIFEKIKQNVCEDEAFRVFNMGCGMCLIAKESNVQAIMKSVDEFNPFIFGKVVCDENCRARFR